MAVEELLVVAEVALVEVAVVEPVDAEVQIFDRFELCNNQWICLPPFPLPPHPHCRPPQMQ